MESSEQKTNEVQNIETEEQEKLEQAKQKRIELMVQMIKIMSAVKLSREDSEPSEILDGLFLGSVGAAMNKDSLTKHGITHILTCASNLSPKFPNDFTYKCLPLLDKPDENIVKYIREANEFIQGAFDKNEEEKTNNKVLVHCFAGKSRSTSFMLAYLMGRKHITLKEALDLIVSKRPIAEPNPGFIIQLKAYEKSLFGKLSDVPIFKSQPKEGEEEKQKDLEAVSQKIASALKIEEDKA